MVLPSLPAGAPVMHPVGRVQAEHLIARGHRRIGYALPAHEGLLPMAEERLQGVAAACTDAGVHPPLALGTSLDADSAARAVAQWREHSVTGVCAFNDETAIAVLAGMREHGLAVPADIAVVGADDIPTARLTSPPLTTVAFDMDQAVERRAMAIVAELSGGREVIESTKLDPRIVPREST
ncbi:LacI family DNA-binding transcriptional regulator [Actinomadura sp. CNU-125]|uniref:LacI family DNA-binding transcriptional regulator n=1 Tax=Actinomadura sp. CNU-125 TaxID=1904961 RepID=UPI0009F8DF49|nr:substrate-binding domain-containing protein [Actinomadura sp. CNU-125]